MTKTERVYCAPEKSRVEDVWVRKKEIFHFRFVTNASNKQHLARNKIKTAQKLHKLHCKYICYKKYTFYMRPEFPCTPAVFFTPENYMQISAVLFVNYSKKLYSLQ